MVPFIVQFLGFFFRVKVQTKIDPPGEDNVQETWTEIPTWSRNSLDPSGNHESTSLQQLQQKDGNRRGKARVVGSSFATLLVLLVSVHEGDDVDGDVISRA